MARSDRLIEEESFIGSLISKLISLPPAILARDEILLLPQVISPLRKLSVICFPWMSPSYWSSILDQSSKVVFLMAGPTKLSLRVAFCRSPLLWFFNEMVMFKSSPG